MMDKAIATLPPTTPLHELNCSDQHVLLNSFTIRLPPMPLAALTSFLAILTQRTFLGMLRGAHRNRTTGPCQAGVSDNASSLTLLSRHAHTKYDSDGDTRTVEEVLAIAVPIPFGAIAVIGFFSVASW
ncbi:hypothetical protein MTO96_039279 [Rhipicephalus appendiculatus]